MIMACLVQYLVFMILVDGYSWHGSRIIAVDNEGVEAAIESTISFEWISLDQLPVAVGIWKVSG